MDLATGGEESARSRFVAEAKAARESREDERRRLAAALAIQAGARGLAARRAFAARIRDQLDQIIGPGFDDPDGYKTVPLPLATSAFRSIRALFFTFQPDGDRGRFFRVSRYLLASMESKEVKTNYVSVALTKEQMGAWVGVMKVVLWQACKYLEALRLDLPVELRELNVALHLLVSFTSTNSWALLRLGKSGDALRPSLNALCANIAAHLLSKGLLPVLGTLLRRGLCRNKPALRPASLSAIFSLSLRPLMTSGWEEEVRGQFLAHILSVPALLEALSEQAQECVALLMSQKVFERTLDAVNGEGSGKRLFALLDGVGALGLLANLIHLGALEKELLRCRLLDFTNSVTRIVHKCGAYVLQQKGQTSHWHPVLGWFAQPLDQGIQAAMPRLVSQLQRLWSPDLVRCLFAHLPDPSPQLIDPDFASPSGKSKSKELSSNLKGLMKSLVDKSSGGGSGGPSLPRHSGPRYTVGSAETTRVGLVCVLYESALATFTQLRYDILSGLCSANWLLPRLWELMAGLSGGRPGKAYLELLTACPSASAPECQILALFSEMAAYLLSILDDVELYEQHQPLPLPALTHLAQFLNFLYCKAIWTGVMSVEEVEKNHLLSSVHSLLLLLAHRDARRPISDASGLWLIKDLKGPALLAELDKGNKRAELLVQKAPHIIPHKDRVVLFRKFIAQDRESQSGSASHLVTIHRGRLVEDAYRQLSLLSTPALKRTLRIRFVNEQGLDEAGIDQDGVFKEFLSQLLTKLTDPSLNLFKVSSEAQLYPSASSDVHENHVGLFDFAGRMLAKAVWEGLVVEVRLAPFFLGQVLGRATGLGYSSFDQLPSLDPELYKSLTYIKHYDGDVADLGLCLCWDEEVMGQVRSYDLVPAGSTIPLTGDNKISYIHHMAHFRMHKQIKEQVTAFTRGFRSLIPPAWSALFAVNEFQLLISGAGEDMDLADLRRHTQYYGGFHNSHRLVCWLWDILQSDFSPGERRLFVQFVTSRSAPPLLGWAELQPPFSVRCVEVAEEEDAGDTLGSVIRGFLTIRPNHHAKASLPQARLPTASTCFNLLKLPNYSRKATLRHKLRYAIHSNTGFELS